ncbi:hypothetical protein PWT90_03941 [Aphanocladium album]|nr:hypothetical protein PWT90_03941 [Aphanocladium album]
MAALARLGSATPLPNNSGDSILQAVFSSFIQDTTSVSFSCSSGADGGPGNSCAIEFKADYSHTFTCVMETPDGGSSRKRTMVDNVTGESRIIGEWTLSKKSGGIQTHSTGFVEYLFILVSSFSPTSETAGAQGASFTKPSEYGVCAGQSGFSAD